MSRLRQRRWVTIAASIAAVVAVLGGVAVVTAADSGDGGDRPLIITAEVQRRTLKDDVTLQGTLGRVEQRQVDAAEAARVGTIAIEDGATVENGQAILSLDGRDSIAVPGDFPFFRGLDVGSEGEDVRQLEEILRGAGYSPGAVDRTYTDETRAALARWQDDRGYPGSAPERSETVTVSLAPGGGYEVGGQGATGVVIGGTKAAPSVKAAPPTKDTDNPRLTITALDAVVAEGAPASFRIEVNDEPIDPLEIALEIGGTATADDVVAPTNRVAFPAATWSIVVDVPTRQDDLVERDETVSITILDRSGYSLGTSSASTTLVSDDLPELHIDGGSSVAEGDVDVINIFADQAPIRDTQVLLTTAGTATADSDFRAVHPVVMIPAGADRVQVEVETLLDEEIEDAERVVVALAAGQAGYTIGRRSETVTTIVGDEGDAARPVVTLRSSATSVAEGQPVPMSVSLDRPLTHDLPIELVYIGTAAAGVDYVPIAGRLVVPAGSTSLALSLPTVQDDVVEADRALGARLAPSDRYLIGTPSEVAATVESDDVPELRLLGGDDDVLVEGGTSTFTIVADQAPVEDIAIGYAANGSATPGEDFEALSGTVVLPAGQTSVVVDLRALDDDVVFRPTDMVVGSWPTRVGQVFVDEGETVQPGTPLLSLTDPELTVTLRASASDRTKLVTGQPVTVKIVGGTTEVEGVISKLDETASIDEQSGEQFYEGTVDVQGLEAADGAAVTIEVVLDEAVDALTVPVAAVKQDGTGQDVVRVIDLEGDGSVREVPVTTGLAEGSYLEVSEGLEGGEVLIVEVDGDGADVVDDADG